MTVKVKKPQVVIDNEEDQSSLSETEEDDSSVENKFSNKDAGQETDNVTGDDIADEEAEAEKLELINEGWADSIAKILRTNKPKRKKSLVLSKAKKLNDLRKKKVVVEEKYEVATEDGKIKKETTVKKIDDNSEPLKKKKRELPNLRVKPNILEKDKERILQKIATKGVVQLFNAVKMQQKDINKKLEEAGPLEVRKEKVLKSIDKRAFLDVLMGEKSTKVDEQISQKSQKLSIKDNNTKSSEWSVLRDDFMMSAKMKDWDKEMENEVESEKEMEVESD